MNDQRWRVWAAEVRKGRVRYRSAEFKCVDCDKWHTVRAKRRNVRYDERDQTLEDQVLDALRTSSTHGCQHKKARAKAEPDAPDDGGYMHSGESGTIGVGAQRASLDESSHK